MPEREELVQQTLFKVDVLNMVSLARQAKYDRKWACKLLYYCGIMSWSDQLAVLNGEKNVIEEEDGGYSMVSRQETRNVIDRLAGRE